MTTPITYEVTTDDGSFYIQADNPYVAARLAVASDRTIILETTAVSSGPHPTPVAWTVWDTRDRELARISVHSTSPHD